MNTTQWEVKIYNIDTKFRAACIRCNVEILVNKQFRELLTHETGRPMQSDGSRTFIKLGMPSVDIAPETQTIGNTVFLLIMKQQLTKVNSEIKAYESQRIYTDQFVWLFLSVVNEADLLKQQ